MSFMITNAHGEKHKYYDYQGIFLHGFTRVAVSCCIRYLKGRDFSNLVIKVQIHLYMEEINQNFAKGWQSSFTRSLSRHQMGNNKNRFREKTSTPQDEELFYCCIFAKWFLNCFCTTSVTNPVLITLQHHAAH